MFYYQIIPIIISSIISCASLILIPISYFGYSYRTVQTNVKSDIISKKIKWSSIRNEENEPFGFFIGWIFFGYRYETYNKSDSNNPCLFCFCSLKTFQELNVQENIEIKKTDSKVTTYSAPPHRGQRQFIKSDIIVTYLVARPHQILCMDRIIYQLNKYKRCTLYINGPYGAGKSSIGLLLAKKLQASFCKEIHLTEPNQMISSLYNQVAPTKKNPLIIVLEEFDIIINKIHKNDSDNKNDIEQHKWLRTQVTNKTQWNTFLDDVRFHPNIIIILTTNLSRQEFINKYDESYIRKGRVDLFETLEYENDDYYYAS